MIYHERRRRSVKFSHSRFGVLIGLAAKFTSVQPPRSTPRLDCTMSMNVHLAPRRPFTPHVLGHAHNDEMHAEPLQQALRDGFSTIEVDVHLVDGKLLVGHSLGDAQARQLELESTYFQPLKERVEQHGGVFPNWPEVTLMLDFKGDASDTYRAVLPLLKKYESMLVKVRGGEVEPGAVRVSFTGNRPDLKSSKDRLAFLDGQLHDVLLHPDQIDPRLTPTVSGNYRMFLRWNGQGEMPAKDRQKLTNLARQCDELHVDMRLWDAPDQANAWEALADCGVDRINTDHLDEFAAWVSTGTRERG